MFSDLFWFTGNKNKTTPTPTPAPAPTPVQTPSINSSNKKNGVRTIDLVNKFRDILETLNDEHLAIINDMHNVNSDRSAKYVLRRMYHYLDQLVSILHENPKIIRIKIREMLQEMDKNEILRQHKNLLINRRRSKRKNIAVNNATTPNNEELGNQATATEEPNNNEESEELNTVHNMNNKKNNEEKNNEEESVNKAETSNSARTSDYPYRTSNYISSQLDRKGKQLNAQQANTDLNNLIRSKFNFKNNAK